MCMAVRGVFEVDARGLGSPFGTRGCLSSSYPGLKSWAITGDPFRISLCGLSGSGQGLSQVPLF